jgi:LysM domain-containing protein
MRRRKLFFFSFSLLTAGLLALLTACGGGDDKPEGTIGQLTNPRDVPTATPWVEQPAIVELDPNAIVPLPAEAGAATPTPAGEGGAPGVCGPKYTIESGDTFSSIATKCGTTTQGMRDANPGIDPLTIRPGDIVNVPAAAP